MRKFNGLFKMQMRAGQGYVQGCQIQRGMPKRWACCIGQVFGLALGLKWYAGDRISALLDKFLPNSLHEPSYSEICELVGIGIEEGEDF